MVEPDRPPLHKFNLQARKIYNPLGFTRFYNFVLWFIFSGALLGFILARAAYTNFDGVFCGGDRGYGAAPGECTAYAHGHYRVGMIMHLVTIVPASILVLLQFMPFIRHRFILFHRINGYVVIILALLTIIAALMIARRAFGGTFDTQAWVGFVAILTLSSLSLGYINIKRLQIDQHRKWMLRAWFYMGSIITVRLIGLCVAPIVTRLGSYYSAMPCWQLAGIHQEYGIPKQALLGLYPGCVPYLNGTSPNQHVVVHAGDFGLPENSAAELHMTFGMTLWLALAIHAIGIEIYLHLTPREHERLRQVSYEKQLEAGMSHPGSAGVTSDRLGDADTWVPKGKRNVGTERDSAVLSMAK